jgi:hypothetical protein
MTEFQAESFMIAYSELLNYEFRLLNDIQVGQGGNFLNDDSVARFQKILEQLEQVCTPLGLDAVAIQVQRIRGMMAARCRMDGLQGAVASLRVNCICDSISKRTFLQLSSTEADYYRGPQLFGVNVETRLPGVADDIAEAGKCYATGRYTAAVFHLMRVMERGVLELAKKLAAMPPGPKPLTDEPWGVILNAINSAINGLPSASEQDKAFKNDMQEEATYLKNVKDVWRNQTMHPKSVYTREEAEQVFTTVRQYMQRLVSII